MPKKWISPSQSECMGWVVITQATRENYRFVPAGDVIKDWIAVLRCSCLVKDVQRLQSFKFFFFMDLVPEGNETIIRSTLDLMSVTLNNVVF